MDLELGTIELRTLLTSFSPPPFYLGYNTGQPKKKSLCGHSKVRGLQWVNDSVSMSHDVCIHRKHQWTSCTSNDPPRAQNIPHPITHGELKGSQPSGDRWVCQSVSPSKSSGQFKMGTFCQKGSGSGISNFPTKLLNTPKIWNCNTICC